MVTKNRNWHVRTENSDNNNLQRTRDISHGIKDKNNHDDVSFQACLMFKLIRVHRNARDWTLKRGSHSNWSTVTYVIQSIHLYLEDHGYFPRCTMNLLRCYWQGL